MELHIKTIGENVVLGSDSDSFTFMDFLQRDAILESENKTKKLQRDSDLKDLLEEVGRDDIH